MAETLDINKMLPTPFEPKRRFRWYLEIEGIDSFLLKQADRPCFRRGNAPSNLTFTQWHVQNMRFELYDSIAPSGAQQVWEWMHDEEVCKEKTNTEYTGRDATLSLLDPVGTIIEKWSLVGMKIQTADFGPLSYSTSPPPKKSELEDEPSTQAGEIEIGWINSTRYLMGPPKSVMTIGIECSVHEAELLF